MLCTAVNGHLKKIRFNHLQRLLGGASLTAALLQQGNVTAMPSVPQGDPRVAEAVSVAHAPKLDGTLDDPLWLSAKPISSFRQREPYEGSVPTEKTEVRIVYTRRAIYLGIHCYDSSGEIENDAISGVQRGIFVNAVDKIVSVRRRHLDEGFELL